ncbi:MAG: NADH-quinone oxidoreductase subunit L [Candidatus Diapherotrites archaeon]
MGLVILFLPLLSFLLVAFFGRVIGTSGAALFTTANLLLCFLFSLILFFSCYNKVIIYDFAPWIDTNLISISWTFVFDSLSIGMFLVVNTVSAFVHLYSIEYMNGDPHQTRFMSYLSLFTFFMLFLVSSGNYLQLFLGWEGVGLASYLLINFWFTRLQANKSALKAVFVNRFGDFFLGMALILMLVVFKTLDFSVIFSSVHFFSNLTINLLDFELNVITIVSLFLFLGAVGKSAQLGLHTWLPDAMEGPTPVSALIHAATMVTAGVFTLIRSSSLLEYSGLLPLVAVFGSLTALFGASVAVFQNDLKKIIAYSTCSQLGYMVFACGLSQYAVSFFHLFNHAFFKALLFLTAGSIIHALSDEQDIRKMGRLAVVLPFSYTMFFIGSLALAGLPFISGYYSKDAILELAFSSNFYYGYFCFVIGVLAAFCTAFYSFRTIVLVFYGKVNGFRSSYEHVHESNLQMTIPLALLCFFSLFSGFIFKDLFIGFGTDFWGNTLFSYEYNGGLVESEFLDVDFKLIPLYVTLLAFFSAILIFNSNYFFAIFKKYFFRTSVIYFFSKKWHFDPIYNNFVSTPFYSFSLYLIFRELDRGIIELFGSYGLSKFTDGLFQSSTKFFQSGYLFNYVQLMLAGVLIFISIFCLSYFSLCFEFFLVLLLFYLSVDSTDYY